MHLPLLSPHPEACDEKVRIIECPFSPFFLNSLSLSREDFRREQIEAKTARQ
jgi:hypothetical protein